MRFRYWPLLPRHFHTSGVSFGRWTLAEDTTLLKKYEELGPSWTVMALSLQSRSPTECRRRWLNLSGTLEGLPKDIRRLVYEEGYEMHSGRLIKIPVERIVSGPFKRLAAAVEPVRFRGERRRKGWSPTERMAVQEGFEQYGPRWDFIAKSLQFRTGRQCRNMMLRRYVNWSERLLNKRAIQDVELPPVNSSSAIEE